MVKTILNHFRLQRINLGECSLVNKKSTLNQLARSTLWHHDTAIEAELPRKAHFLEG
jgi:hypothetical protein